MNHNTDIPFYHAGIAFSCRPGCAACCKISGHVDVAENEIPAMAALLGITPEAFQEQFVRKQAGKLRLGERPDGGCILLDENDRCRVHSARPLQCRTYPFWPEVLANEFTWILEKRICPGIGEGKLYSREEIEAILEERAEAAGFADETDSAEGA